jgi:hypothetical protein
MASGLFTDIYRCAVADKNTKYSTFTEGSQCGILADGDKCPVINKMFVMECSNEEHLSDFSIHEPFILLI